ncbi:hypothetical protein D5F01_LYC16976 [Larimichthys crocea]|uniref:Uncharacterized protein n=1 Tax=Larimichthys crocea TaxID=215358 RepID=A0A6G0I1W3_LARCR|nr:hypothetical protein D5F01_LYC16976 [Larimichthys crocea]
MTDCLLVTPSCACMGFTKRELHSGATSSINSLTYNITNHGATILAPLAGNTPHHVHNSMDFVNKVRGLKLDTDETMVSYDVTSRFTCIPTREAAETVKQRLLQDNTLHSRTNLSPDQIYGSLDFCLNHQYHPSWPPSTWKMQKPAWSPDLSPFENVWSIMKLKKRQQRPPNC